MKNHSVSLSVGEPLPRQDRRLKRWVLIALCAVIGYTLLTIIFPFPVSPKTSAAMAFFCVTAVIMWLHWFRHHWLGAGFIIYALSFVAALWLVAHGHSTYMAIDDPLRLLGIAIVGFFCVRSLPRVSMPVTLWCLGGFYVGCFAIQVLLCVYRASTPWDGILHVLSESMVIVASLPAVAAVMAGRAPSGRLLWFLGWQLLWLAHMIVMPMQNGLLPYNVLSLGNFFNLASCFLAIGIVAEIRRWDMGLWHFVLGVGALLTGWLATIIKLAAAPDLIFLNLLVGGGVMLFANAYILLVSYQSAITRAQEALQKERLVLQDVTTAKGEFLASLSHELRTPLNAIIGFAEAMADGAMGTLDELQQELVFEIRRGGERLLHLINRVLDYSRLEAGRMPIVRQDIELASWLGKLLAPHLEHAQQKGIALHLDIKPDIKGWHLDPTLTQLAIDELLDNAMRFTDTGTITLQADRDDHHQLRITITDTGPGIDETHRPRLYKPLEQFGRDRERGLQKAGLGLALAKEAIMSQGGILELIPSRWGTCFVITLPAEVAPQPGVMLHASALPLPQTMTTVPAPRAFPWVTGGVLVGLVILVIVFASIGEMSGRLMEATIFLAAAFLAWKAGRSLSYRMAACGAGGVALGFYLLAWMVHAHWTVLYQWRWAFLSPNYVLFVCSFALLRPRRWPMNAWPGYALLMGASLISVAFVASHDHSTNSTIYLWIGLFGVGVALPTIEYGLRGLAAPGRLIWIGGLVLFWLGAYGQFLALALPLKVEVFFAGFIPLYTSGVFLAGAGLFIESRRWDIGIWSLILVVGSALLAWSIGTVVLRPFPHVLAYWVITGGCTIYLLALAILVSHHNRAKHMTQTLQEAHEAARQASLEKNRFLTTMSHELRTPLNAVLGFADVLKSGDAGALSPEATDAIMEIEHAGEHLLSLVEDIMDLSSVEEGTLTLEASPIDVPALLKNSLAIVKERAHRKSIKLHLDIAPDIGTCTLDGRKVKQLVFNLLSNAVKFTPEGGTVTLGAKLVPREAVLAHRNQPGCNAHALASASTFLAITVSDSGIGIAAEDLPQLFQKYSQLEAGRQQQGTGLGLSLVKDFAELHGGIVMVESEVGRGSRFVVWVGGC